jgi:hypothetical protein
MQFQCGRFMASVQSVSLYGIRCMAEPSAGSSGMPLVRGEAPEAEQLQTLI